MVSCTAFKSVISACIVVIWIFTLFYAFYQFVVRLKNKSSLDTSFSMRIFIVLLIGCFSLLQIAFTILWQVIQYEPVILFMIRTALLDFFFRPMIWLIIVNWFFAPLTEPFSSKSVIASSEIALPYLGLNSHLVHTNSNSSLLIIKGNPKQFHTPPSISSSDSISCKNVNLFSKELSEFNLVSVGQNLPGGSNKITEYERKKEDIVLSISNQRSIDKFSACTPLIRRKSVIRSRSELVKESKLNVPNLSPEGPSLYVFSDLSLTNLSCSYGNVLLKRIGNILYTDLTERWRLFEVILSQKIHSTKANYSIAKSNRFLFSFSKNDPLGTTTDEVLGRLQISSTNGNYSLNSHSGLQSITNLEGCIKPNIVSEDEPFLDSRRKRELFHEAGRTSTYSSSYLRDLKRIPYSKPFMSDENLQISNEISGHSTGMVRRDDIDSRAKKYDIVFQDTMNKLPEQEDRKYREYSINEIGLARPKSRTPSRSSLFLPEQMASTWQDHDPANRLSIISSDELVRKANFIPESITFKNLVPNFRDSIDPSALENIETSVNMTESEKIYTKDTEGIKNGKESYCLRSRNTPNVSALTQSFPALRINFFPFGSYYFNKDRRLFLKTGSLVIFLLLICIFFLILLLLPRNMNSTCRSNLKFFGFCKLSLCETSTFYIFGHVLGLFNVLINLFLSVFWVLASICHYCRLQNVILKKYFFISSVLLFLFFLGKCILIVLQEIFVLRVRNGFPILMAGTHLVDAVHYLIFLYSISYYRIIA